MRPSLIAWIVNSAPTIFSSISTESPALSPASRLSAYSRASSWLARWGPMTFTPLPPVRPEGFTTIGVEPNDAIASSTSSARVDDAQARRRLGRHLEQQRAREGLVPLDLSSRARRTDRARALRQQRVDDARLQRFVGADHRHVDLVGARERGDGVRVAHVADLHLAAGLPRAAHERRVEMPGEREQLAVLRHAGGEGALSPAVTDDQRSHARRV